MAALFYDTALSSAARTRSDPSGLGWSWFVLAERTDAAQMNSLSCAQASGKVVGSAQSRGAMLYQQDAYTVCSLDLPTRELRKNLRDSDNTDAIAWRPHRHGDREPATQQVGAAFL